MDTHNAEYVADDEGGGHGSAGRDAWREYQQELGPWPITSSTQDVDLIAEDCRCGLCLSYELQGEEDMPDSADTARLRTACSAVLHGAIWDGFNGPTGVSKDEALEYAVELAEWVMQQIDGKVSFGGRECVVCGAIGSCEHIDGDGTQHAEYVRCAGCDRMIDVRDVARRLPTGAMFCLRCTLQLIDGSGFCGECGERELDHRANCSLHIDGSACD